ncbi:hypothetical protein ACEWY4_025535 [Coilia grayii]|uniref:SWIM-type domain-containing protein n=1 Tax=Coilia grayii TaxID=363190 RepID=A0ABD1J0X7_9TELE
MEVVGQPALSGHDCSCAAGKGFCCHVAALLYQTAHYVQLGLTAVPPTLSCTSQPQMWHRPRTQVCVLSCPKCSINSLMLHFSLWTCFFLGPLPDPHLLASGARLSQIHPRPLLSHILEGMSNLELVPCQFGLVPRGSTLSYQCPPFIPDNPVVDFPLLPLSEFSLNSNLAFVPNHHQTLHLESLKVSVMSVQEIEKSTREQSKCAAWAQLRRSRVTASRFRKVCHVVGETSGKGLAMRIIRGTKQTCAMKRGLELESSIIRKYLTNSKSIETLI